MAVKTLMKWLVSVGMILAAVGVLTSAGGARAVSAAGLRETAAGTAKWNSISIPLDASDNTIAPSPMRRGLPPIMVARQADSELERRYPNL